jgi:hypothetical protein
LPSLPLGGAAYTYNISKVVFLAFGVVSCPAPGGDLLAVLAYAVGALVSEPAALFIFRCFAAEQTT